MARRTSMRLRVKREKVIYLIHKKKIVKLV
jgi:hypothetical protein